MPANLRFLVLMFFAAAQAVVLAPIASAGDPAESDWLIERWNGQWTLAAKGAAGRVEKTAPNQEILRMGGDGTVLVMSMPALAEGETLLCFSSKRHDYRSFCSSTFLDCTNSADGAYVTLFNGALGFNMADIRTRLECRIDTNAVLRAAKAVGMISTILPVVDKADRVP